MIITRPKLPPLVKHFRERLSHSSSGVKKPVERLKQMRIYIRSRLHGASSKEAKSLAGLPTALQDAVLMQQKEATVILQEILKEDDFKDQGIVKRLKEMWHHKKVRIQKAGDEVIPVEEDDTDMWKYSMDKVLELRGFKKKEESNAPKIEASGGVTFNVLQIPNDK